MGISLDKLIFDTANPDNGANVGAYVRASDGTLIGHTGGALNVAATISATDLDIRDLDASQDNVAISDGTDTLAINGDGSLNAVVTATDLDIRDLAFATDKVDVTGSEVSLDATTLAALENITVSATDLDIRDLAFATDKVDVTGSEVSLDAGTLAALENITVSATDFDIRNLSASQDNVAISDGADTLAINADGSINVNLTDDSVADDAPDSGNPFKVGSRAFNGALGAVSASNDRADLLSDMYRRVYVNDSPNISQAHKSVTVAVTATQLDGTPLLGRKRVIVQNHGNKDVYLGGASVTTANGLRLSTGASMEMPWGEDITIYAISSSGNQDIRFLEIG